MGWWAPAALGISLVCVLLFGGTSLAKNVLGSGGVAEQQTPPASAEKESAEPREEPKPPETTAEEAAKPKREEGAVEPKPRPAPEPTPES